MGKKLVRFSDIISISLFAVAIILQLVLIYKRGYSLINAVIIILMSANILLTVRRIIKTKRHQD